MISDTEKETFKVTSFLPAIGFTHTHSDLHAWLRRVVLEVKKNFGEREYLAKVWPYREQGREFISCDIWCEREGFLFPITICAEGEQDFFRNVVEAAEADTHDMAEAVHLAGLIVSALNATVCLGLHVNEINRSLLAQPLNDGETNGCIQLDFSTENSQI